MFTCTDLASRSTRVTAPAGFGRRHVAPLVPGFLAGHAELSLSLNLSDRVVDIVHEGFDCAVRVGDLPDSRPIRLQIVHDPEQCFDEILRPGRIAGESNRHLVFLVRPLGELGNDADTVGAAEILAEDEVIARWPLAIPASNVTIVPVESMFAGEAAKTAAR